MVVRHYGEPDVLTAEEVHLDAPASGEVLVRLAVAGINFVDIYQRRGFRPVPLPFIPGLEGAGVVEAVGPGVGNVKPGDRVAYAQQPGAYAEASVVPARRRSGKRAPAMSLSILNTISPQRPCV
ncbi:alcohol dehydrogenase catalytic domain-containing protein [Nonomuraea sp. NPDC003201]